MSTERIVVHTGLLLLIVGTAVALVLWLQAPRTRYRSYPGHYAMIFAQQGDVDLAVLGSSRTQTLFDAFLLSDNLREYFAREPVIYDLSKPWRGTGFQYVLTRDLLERRTVRHLLLEFKRNVDNVHEHFHQLARLGDLAESTLVAQRKPLWLRVQLLLRLVTQKLSFYATVALAGPEAPQLPSTTARATTADFSPSDPVSPQRLEQWRRRYAGGWETRPDAAWSVTGDQEARTRHYINRIVALARAHGTQVTLFHLPKLYHPPLDAGFVGEVEREFGVPLLRLPRERLREVFPAGYGDHAHANSFGTAYQMRWFAERLVAVWTSDPT